MSQEESTSAEEETSIFQEAQDQFNEYKERFNSSETGQELKEMYNNVNTQLKKLGKMTSDAVNKQTKELRSRYEKLRDDISSRMKEDETETESETSTNPSN